MLKLRDWVECWSCVNYRRRRKLKFCYDRPRFSDLITNLLSTQTNATSKTPSLANFFQWDTPMSKKFIQLCQSLSIYRQRKGENFIIKTSDKKLNKLSKSRILSAHFSRSLTLKSQLALPRWRHLMIWGQASSSRWISRMGFQLRGIGSIYSLAVTATL
jgi:hypothetical protein